MRHRTAPRAVLLTTTLGLLLMATPSLAQTNPPVTPTTTAAAPRVRARTSYTAFLRTEPQRAAGTDRAVIAAGTEVEVSGVVADEGTALGGYWYAVRAFPIGTEPIDGWMHSTIVYLAPEQLAQLAETDAAAPGVPPATPDPTAAASPPADVTPTPTVAPTAATLAVPLALRVCYDLHANKTCDVDEGIAGVMVYGTDAATGQILGQTTTDATGLARLVWQAAADDSRAQLTLTVPYFQEVRTVQPTQPTIEPVLITTLAPIPAWLP